MKSIVGAALLLILGPIFVAAAILAPNAWADPNDTTTTCIENGQVNTYIGYYPCPNNVGPTYGGGNHRWPDGID